MILSIQVSLLSWYYFLYLVEDAELFIATYFEDKCFVRIDLVLDCEACFGNKFNWLIIDKCFLLE